MATHDNKDEEGIRRESVELSLEESGVLCHLLLSSFKDSTKLVKLVGGESFLSDAPYGPFGKRMRELYMKLADANDKLMGKKR